MNTLPTDLTRLCHQLLDVQQLTLLHQSIDRSFLILPSNQKRLCSAFKTNNYPWILYLHDKINCIKYLGKAIKYHHDWVIKKYLQHLYSPDSLTELVNTIYKYNRFELVHELKPHVKSEWFRHTVDIYFWYGVLGYNSDSDYIAENINKGIIDPRDIHCIRMQGFAYGGHYELFNRAFESIQNPNDLEWSSYFWFNDEDLIIDKIGDRHQQFRSYSIKSAIRLSIMHSHWRLVDILLSYHIDLIAGTEIVEWLLSVDRFDLIDKYFGPDYTDPICDEEYIINIRNNSAKPTILKTYDVDITNTVLYRYVVIEMDEFKTNFFRKLYSNVDLVVLEDHINKLKTLQF